jgi:hypothetical protein
MDRRTFLSGRGALILATPLAAELQSAKKVYGIAMYLSLCSRFREFKP